MPVEQENWRAIATVAHIDRCASHVDLEALEHFQSARTAATDSYQIVGTGHKYWLTWHKEPLHQPLGVLELGPEIPTSVLPGAVGFGAAMIPFASIGNRRDDVRRCSEPL